MSIIHTKILYLCRNESEDIKDIIDKVSHLLNKTDLFIANNPVGIESQVQDVIQLLHARSNGVLLLGMWGMGGLAKQPLQKPFTIRLAAILKAGASLQILGKMGGKLPDRLVYKRNFYVISAKK